MVPPTVQLSLGLELILTRDNHNLCLGERRDSRRMESLQATLTVASSIMEDQWQKDLT